MNTETRRRVLRYAIAINLVIFVTGVGLLLPQLSGDAMLYLYLVAVALAAWKGGGSKGALLATLLSVIAAQLTFGLMDFQTAAIFVGAGLVITLIAHPSRKSAAPKPADVEPPACFHCGERFDLSEADWCTCLTNERTLVCTNCLTCFCKAPPAYQDRLRTGMPPREVAPPSYTVMQTPGMRPLVMLVERDAAIQQVVQRVCNNLGYGFVAASEGEEALALARRHRPNLVLAEGLLAKLDSRELCRLLKREQPEVRAVVLTGLYPDTRYRAEALAKSGVDDYAAKPLSITELIGVLEKHLEGVTGLAPQVDLHALHRGTSHGDTYQPRCLGCGKPFDAMKAAWCNDADPTVVCPACGSCFCADRQRLWRDAPAQLFERKVIVAHRTLDAAPDLRRPLLAFTGGDDDTTFLARTVATTLGYGFVTEVGEHKPEVVLSARDLPKPLEVGDVLRVLRTKTGGL